MRSTYFTFRGKYYEQVEGTAMGSPISPIVANLFMEDFENRALQSSINPPLLWKRFVDDTFVIMKKCHREEFLTHLNSVDKNIQFTAEKPGPEGALPFLDILINQIKKAGSIPLCTGSQPTWTSTSTGTVYILFHLSIVWLELSITEPEPYALTNSC